jgi:hypothetical protein
MDNLFDLIKTMKLGDVVQVDCEGAGSIKMEKIFSETDDIIWAGTTIEEVKRSCQ